MNQNSIPRITLLTLLCTLLLVGCTYLAKHELDTKYGPSSPDNRNTHSATTDMSFYKEVKPILDARCVVCHACYDAPCQTKLSSPEGIERGGSKLVVYNGLRLLAMEPSRLYIDAIKTKDWREKGFHSILNERDQSPEANLRGSTLFRLLELKRQNPTPEGKILPPSIDLSIDRAQSCPSIEEFGEYEELHPLGGMPYGLPPVSQGEFNTLRRWIEKGAPIERRPTLGKPYRARVAKWESFLNKQSNKAKLVSRYIFEHIFLANVYFEELPPGEFFRIVRSSTPPGEEIVPIPTRRPFEDPGPEPFFYRLMRQRSTITIKTHLPYALSDKRLNRWKSLFFTPDYQVSELPGYQPQLAANPFKVFHAIPVESRYRFLLDDAEFYIMGFIKGPVCRGNTALSVIDDRFWVFFANPEGRLLKHMDTFLSEESDNLVLPAAEESNSLLVTEWLKYSSLHKKHLEAKAAFLEPIFKTPNAIGLDLVWDGEGKNSNAALTVFRHFDSASVVKGLVGTPPKTAWIISYGLLERIHYLLVAGFDLYGNIGHQVVTRLYMDFLRMEGEFNFLSLLPVEEREKERDYWYREAPDSVREYISWPHEQLSSSVSIPYQTNQPKLELFQMLKKRLSKVIARRMALGENEVDLHLRRIEEVQSSAAQHMPQLSLLRVQHRGTTDTLYSITHDSAHLNIASLANEEERRKPDEDRLTIARGTLGSYPNALFSIKESDVSKFVRQVSSINSDSDYDRLKDRFGIRRTSGDFWAFSDWLNAYSHQLTLPESGLFDYSRLENR